MEWISTIKTAIQFMEDNLLSVKSIDEVADASHISTMYLQQGFTIITGLSLGEYIRNRKLYKAALDICESDEKIIDIAFKYGYETPESFTKAFSRFHNATPLAVKKNHALVKTFLPFKVNIVVRGGTHMNVVVEKKSSIKLIGLAKEFSSENSFTDVPRFWDEYYKKFGRIYSTPDLKDEELSDAERAVIQNCIGQFAICIDDIGKKDRFKYLIGGVLNEESSAAKEFLKSGKLPEGLEFYELPEMTWARFSCYGKLPDAMQAVYKQIWNEWLPGNEKYELSGKLNVEFYYRNMEESEIWMPVKERK